MRTALRRHFPGERLEFLIDLLQRRDPWLVRNRESQGINLKWGGVAVQSLILRDGAIRKALVPLPYGDFSHQSSVPHGVEGKEMVWGRSAIVLTGDALLSLLSAAGLCPNPSPAERPALCHPAHNPGHSPARQGETTECLVTTEAQGQTCARAEDTEGRKLTDVSVELH